MCLPHIAYCAANLAAVEYENYNSDGSMVNKVYVQAGGIFQIPLT